MLNQLRNLNTEEKQVILRAPIWVSLLIAGADEDLDPTEIDKAKEVINIRTYTEDSELRALYKELNQDLDHAIQVEINHLPMVGEKRIANLEGKLQQLNAILPKLERAYATDYYNGLKRLAAIVAQSDGGFFGIGAISYKEAAYLQLQMINKP